MMLYWKLVLIYQNRYGRPLVQFDPEAERRLRWKIDLYVIPTVAMLYLFCFIDRANIGKTRSSNLSLPSFSPYSGNAKIAGLTKDLKLEGYNYNIVLTAFYI